MTTRLTMSLEREERHALARLAKMQKRAEREQAAYIVRRELERLGFLEPIRMDRQPAECGGQGAG